MEFSNAYAVPFNCLGLVLYLVKNKPVQQPYKRGVYFEGITIANGHFNEKTGELDQALVREFEHDLPALKIRVQCVRSSSGHQSGSIPIFVKVPGSKPLRRFFEFGFMSILFLSSLTIDVDIICSCLSVLQPTDLNCGVAY